MKNIVLITGTRKGLGKFLADTFLQREWIVIGCSRSEETINHPNYRHHCIDVSDEKLVKAMFKATRKEFGKIDALINNAGIAAMNHLVLSPLDSANSIFSTNLIGSFLCMREASKLLRKSNHGRIINFSTVAAPLRLEGEALYAASKRAVESITQVASKELAEWGITVNAVGPTPVPTDLIKAVPKAKIQDLLAKQAIQRMGSPEDVLNVIDFFLQESSSFITGQIIYLGGVVN